MKQAGAIYVQYGCGRSCPDGWINFDASPTRCRVGDRKDGNFRLVEDAGRFYDGTDGVEECAMEAMKREGHS